MSIRTDAERRYRTAVAEHPDNYEAARDASALAPETFDSVHRAEQASSLDDEQVALQPEPSAAAELLALLADLDDDLERQVIVLYAGLDGDDPMSGPEIAEVLGLSRKTVDRIRLRAIENMKINVENERNA